jgi:hypothetical protein
VASGAAKAAAQRLTRRRRRRRRRRRDRRRAVQSASDQPIETVVIHRWGVGMAARLASDNGGRRRARRGERWRRRSDSGAVGWRRYGVGAACAQRGRGAWQPRGEGTLTGGSGAERETDKWVPRVSDF